jgi:hypothetical protein
MYEVSGVANAYGHSVVGQFEISLAAGITDHVLDVEDMVKLLEEK